MVYASERECSPHRGLGATETTSLALQLFQSSLSGVGVALGIASSYSNAMKLKEFIDDELEMMRRYYDLAKAWQDIYNNVYKPGEDEEAAEAFALEDVEPEYDIARGRARTTAWIQFKGVTDKATRCLSMYCTGLRSDMIAELAAAQGAAVSAADGLGYRNERAYVEARNEEIWHRKFNTVKRGRNLMADNVSLAKATNGIYGDMAQQAWVGMQGADKFVGYFLNKNETVFPTTYVKGKAQYQGELESMGAAVERTATRKAGEVVSEATESGMGGLRMMTPRISW